MNNRLKWSLFLIQAWPFNNKIRLANLLIPNKPRPIPIFEGVFKTKEGFDLHINTNSYIEYSVFTLGYYEKEVANLIKENLNEGDIALDIGANVGIHTVLMAKCVGVNGKILAFEPLSFIRNRLKSNIELNGLDNVVIDRRALSNQKEKKEIFFDPNRHNQGMFSLTWQFQKTNETIEVDKGDDVLNEYKLSNIKLIKMDVEGFELFALAGLKNSIERYKPAIVFEFSNYYHGANDKQIEKEVLDMLNELKYRTFSITASGLKEIDLSLVSNNFASNIYAIAKN